MAMNTSADLDFTEDTFRVALPSMIPLIKREWPDVDVRRLRECEGDLDACISLIAEETPETKGQVRKHLEELHRLAISDYRSGDISKMKGMLYRIEAKTNDIAHRVRTDTLPAVRTTMGQNLLLTVFASLGLGALIGFLLVRRLTPPPVSVWRDPVRGLRDVMPWWR